MTMLTSLTTATILIVDDTPENLEVLSESLIAAGYRVAAALDGESAIEQASFAPPDLILLDVMMPGIDGFETCFRLKSAPVTQAIPVVFMTALSETQHKVRGFSLGAVDYITKPFQREEVLARVQVHLQLCNYAQTLTEQNQRLKAEVEQRQLAETKLAMTLDTLQQTQVQLIQKEKLSALGELVAGVGHEISNPVNFLTGNLSAASAYIEDLTEIVGLYQRTYVPATAEIETACRSNDLPFILEDLPKLIHSMELGAERIREISAALRNFARTDPTRKLPVDLHQVLNSTLLILNHRLKCVGHRPAIDVIKQYGEIPIVDCLAGQMSQVLMNILANAIDALEEANQDKNYSQIEASPNQIVIQTRRDGPWIIISIADNGVGMSAETCAQIFNAQFTTKAVGKGTGLGLAIAYQIVTEKHGGMIEVNSKLAEGTEFIIKIPVLPVP
jgi:signal transduction histidine kinase